MQIHTGPVYVFYFEDLRLNNSEICVLAYVDCAVYQFALNIVLHV